MIDLELLIRFSVVAEELSFSRAARRMGVDQPWLSRQIRKLEELLGFSLLIRSTRQVSLTDEGARVLGIAREVAAVSYKAQAEIGILKREHETVIRLGMHPYVYWSGLMRRVRRQFEADVPGATIDVASNTSARNIARLEAGSLDVALVIEDDSLSRFATLPVLQVQPSLLLPLEMPLASRQEVALADIVGLPIAISDPKHHQVDFDQIYGPFFANGAIPKIVREGATAVHHYAEADRFAMVSIRNADAPPGEGFTRVVVRDVAPTRFVLARLKEGRRGLVGRFWASASRAIAEGGEESPEALGAEYN